MKRRMKSHLAVALALILAGSGCYVFGNVSEAAEVGHVAEPSSQGTVSGNDAGVPGLDSENIDLPPETDAAVDSQGKAELNKQVLDSIYGKNGKADTNLQIPEKITVVIDPWEIGGEGQVHSEQYVIRNIGMKTVKLRLYQFACVPLNGNSGIVRADKTGIHEGSDKAIYMEMVIGNGGSVLFTEEGTGSYEVELGAGEELSFYITGEVNENAVEPWRDGDFQVMISYQWDDGSGTLTAADDGLPVPGVGGDVFSDAAADEKTEGDEEGSVSDGDLTEEESTVSDNDSAGEKSVVSDAVPSEEDPASDADITGEESAVSDNDSTGEKSAVSDTVSLGEEDNASDVGSTEAGEPALDGDSAGEVGSALHADAGGEGFGLNIDSELEEGSVSDAAEGVPVP